MSDVMEYTGQVKVIGGAIDGESYRRAKITVLGEEFKLAAPDNGRFRQVDRITSGKLTDTNGVVVVSGVSEFLTGEVGLDPEGAHVRWEMKVRGCQSCR